VKPIVSLRDYELRARDVLQPVHYDYFAGGAQHEMTVRENVAAFDRIKLRPRVLRGEFRGGADIALLDVPLSMPIVVAPTAFHRLAHQDGERATARATLEAGTVMTISMASTIALEEIVGAAPKAQAGRFWFQLYIQPDRDFTLELVRRAETAGCSALVVTVDSPVFGHRERDRRNRFFDLPDGLHCANLKVPRENLYRSIEFDPALSWKDIDWLCSSTRLPVVLKGILHPEDALLATEHGAGALMVSNHGGRQLDGIAATIDLLPAVVCAIEGRVPIILDGGVRRGTDVLKALALGAAAVAIGRPVIWGLAVSGSAGVTGVLNFLKQDLLNALLLSGCESLESVDAGVLFAN
jgi:4-hydroxymandelate oxidase